MSIQGDLSPLILRLRDQEKRLSVQDPRTFRFITKIGIDVTRDAKQIARDKRIIDTGNLINHIQYQIRKSGDNTWILRFGSFGVPYAAIHEFGGRIRYPNGGVRHVKSRSYMRESVRKNTNNITAVLRKLYSP